jgi:hypothetical protein
MSGSNNIDFFVPRNDVSITADYGNYFKIVPGSAPSASHDVPATMVLASPVAPPDANGTTI